MIKVVEKQYSLLKKAARELLGEDARSMAELEKLLEAGHDRTREFLYIRLQRMRREGQISPIRAERIERFLDGANLRPVKAL